MLIGTGEPSLRTIAISSFTIGSPVSIVRRSTQAVSQIVALKTSAQMRPIASSRGMPVICSAALLKEVIRQSRPTVNTPSAMLSRMMSVCDTITI